MELLQCLLPCPRLLQLNSYEIDLESHHLILNVSSTQTIAQCPLCGGLTQRVHSRYQRTLTHLPCMHFSLSLLVQVCKFFCPNSGCCRRIFTERLPKVAAPWARKTLQLVQKLQAIGLALGGAAGSRLANHLGFASCGTTLLNHLQRLALPELEVPKTLGVDDFAFRKGRQYGTILVNLETHQPIALLADRKAQTLADWLRDHPGVEVLSRDRSKTYKSAMDKGAPKALQVLDSFHLVKNLSETLEIAFGNYRAELKAAAKAHHIIPIADPAETVVVTPQPTAIVSAQQQSQTKHQLRVQQQQQIKALHAQRWPIGAIAEKVGVSTRTVLRYRTIPDFSETHTRRLSFGRSLLDPHKQEIVDWWNSGMTNSNVLMVLLQHKGYKGSQRTLQRYLCGLRDAQGPPKVSGEDIKPPPKVIDPQVPPFTPRQAAYLIVVRAENREAQEQQLLDHLVKQHPDLATLMDLAHEFLDLLRQQRADSFDNWLMKTLTCEIQSLKRFATGLLDDYAAVKASMMSQVSNGPVEGLNNRLKMLKRQMFGKAGLELLTKRFIIAS